MSFAKIFLFSFTIFYILSFTFTQGADIDVINKCPYTVWAAASPGGGTRLETGQTWKVKVQPGTTKAHIWGRTGCTFDADGKGICDTGDCGGILACEGRGTSPNTVAELLPSQTNIDFIDVSVVDGFNIPMEFSPVGASCKAIRCAADINGECPGKLRTKGGCNNACKVFNNAKYCCPAGNSCEPNEYSKFFKEKCPDTYSYPDDQTGLFSCPGGSNYKVVFCP